MNWLLGLFSQPSSTRNPLPPVRAAPPQGILKKIGAERILELMQCSSAGERKEKRRFIGQCLVQMGKDWPSVDWQSFAVFHNASMIEQTKYDGSYISKAILSWISILNIWQKGQGQLFTSRLTPEQITRLLLVLQKYYEMDKRLPHTADAPLSQSELEDIVEGLLGEIKRQIASDVVYIPLGYRHGLKNQGHLLPLKFETKGENVFVHILNSGEGSEEHPTLSYTPYQEKNSYRYFPIKISKKIFFGELGQVAWCHVCRYITDPPNPDYEPYSSQDIYGIFLLLGEVVPAFEGNTEVLEVKGQRSGNCSAKGVKAVAKEELNDMHVPLNERGIVFLNITLTSLISGYHTYKRFPREEHRLLLRNAIEEAGLAILKLENLDPDEVMMATALIEYLKKETKTPVPKRAAPTIRDAAPIKVEGYKTEFPLLPIETHVVERKEKTEDSCYPAALVIPEFRVDTLADDITRWSKALCDLPVEQRLNYLNDCTLTFPVPAWGKKDVWDALETRQIEEVIQGLTKLLRAGLHETKIEGQISKKALAIHTIFAISDKLARRDAKNNLDGYASPYLPLLFNKMYPREITTLPMGREHVRYSQVVSYFEQSWHAAEKRAIFPIAPVLSIGKFVYDSTHKHPSCQGDYHLQFLQQFLTLSFPNHNNRVLTPLYFEVWVDSAKKHLPSAIHSLYYFSFLSHLLYSSSSSDPFPAALTFKRGVDNRGMDALTLADRKDSLFTRLKRQYCDKGQWSFAYQLLENEIRHEGFLNIFDPAIQQLRTNDAVTAHLDSSNASSYKVSEPIYRGLLRITRKDNLKASLALQWATSHLIYLNHHGIQALIDHCLFSPRGVGVRLMAEKSVIIPMREMVRKGLDYYLTNVSHVDVLLYLICTGICFESIYGELYGKEECKEQLRFYQHRLIDLLEKNLKEEKKNEVLIHLLFLLLEESPESKEEIQKVFELMFQLPKLMPRYPGLRCPWLKNKIEDLYRQNLHRFKTRLDNPSFLNGIAKTVAANLLPNEKMAEDWIGIFPAYSCGEFEIDFQKITLKHRSKGTLVRLEIPKHFSEIVPHLQKIHGHELWEKGNVCESQDGRFRIAWDDKGNHYERLVQFRGEVRWCDLHHFHCDLVDELGIDFLTYPSELPLAHYRLKEKRKGDPEILIYRADADKPYFAIYFENGRMVLRKMDERGMDLPIVLINLSDFRENTRHPLYHLAGRFGHAPFVLCFVNTITGEIEELNFYRLGLRFVKSAQGLASLEYPGFCFLPFESLALLNHYVGAMVLENGQGQRKVILPANFLESSSEDFSTEVKPKKDFAVTQRFFDFELNAIEDTLSIRNQRNILGYLYLSLLFKMQKDYENAYKYLQKTKVNTFFSHHHLLFINRFMEIEDRSAPSKAFNAKLAAFLIENSHLLLEEQFKQENQSWAFKSILAWTAKVYIAYLHTMSGAELSAAPKFLRLTNSEERNILIAMKKYYEDGKIPFPQLMQIRYELVFKKNARVPVTISSKEVKTCPSAYKLLVEPNELKSLFLQQGIFPYGHNRKDPNKSEDLSLLAYPIRCHIGAVSYHFIDLYECARSAPAQSLSAIDFTLLGLLKASSKNSKWSVDSIKLVSLLFYIRLFPQQFHGLAFSFAGAVDDQSQITLFNGIVRQAMNLPNFTEMKKIKIDRVVNFDYHRELILDGLIVPPRCVLPSLPKRTWEKEPFKRFRLILLGREEIPLERPDNPPFLDQTLAAKSCPLEQLLDDTSLAGYRVLPRTAATIYCMNHAELPRVKKTLEEQKSLLSDKLESSRKEILLKANKAYKLRPGSISREGLEVDLNHILAEKSLQKLPIHPETLMKEVILRNNLSFLTKHCPLLSQGEMSDLIEKTKLYYHLLVQYQMVEEALNLMGQLSPDNIQKLGELLDYEFLYDPLEYPEISYFKLTQGKLPRPDQVRIYQWVCEGLERGENRLFQGQAGLGKTTYLTPLLKLRAKKYNLLPVFITTQEIYPVDKVNLGNTLASLEQALGYLEVGLHMRLSAEQYRFIFNQLHLYFREGTSLIITPQIIYALRLIYFHAALIEKDEEKVKWVGMIRHFFKTKCLLLMDESHKNLNPLTRAIYGASELFPLPENERKLFIKLLRPLLGTTQLMTREAHPRLVSQVARMEGNLLGRPDEKDVQILQQTLAYHMVENLPKATEDYIPFWTTQGAAPPNEFKMEAEEDKKFVSEASLVGYFIRDLLPEILKMRAEFDHGPSIYPEEEFDIPYHHKAPSTAQFEDAYRALAVSIRGTFHRGLKENQIRVMIEHLIKKDWEHNETRSEVESKSAKIFKRLIDATDLKGLHLRDVSISDPKELQALHLCLFKMPAAIEYYLKKHILHKVGYCLDQLIATPAHLLGDFHLTVSFAATPLPEAATPLSIQSFLYTPELDAQVALVFCKEENQGKLITESPDTFFNFIVENHSELFETITVFFDPRGFFCDFPNRDVAAKWLQSSKSLDGILFFREGNTLSVDRHENICLMLRDKRIIELEGSDVKAALKEHKLDWDSLKLGTFYDSSHVESTDIPQKKGTKSFFFVGDHLTGSQITQTLMRKRGFINPTMKQTTTWVIPRAIESKIPLGSSGKIDGAAIYAWARHNEAEELRKKIILCGFQEIAYLVGLEVEEQLFEQMNDLENGPKKQIEICDRYRQGIIETRIHDPYAAFGMPTSQLNSGTVLWAYAKKLYSQYGFAIDIENKSDLKDQIQSIIKRVEGFIATIPTNFSQQVSKEIEQHCKIKKETETLQYRPRPIDPLSADGEYGTIKITSGDYLKSWRTEVRTLFDNAGFTENFFLERNQTLTARDFDKPMEVDFLKPVDFMMIVFSDKVPEAWVISNEILTTELKEMTTCPTFPELPHRVMLLTSDGMICQRGHGALTPRDEEVKEVMDSLWIKDLVIDAALLRCEIRYPERLLERMKTWPDFEALWDRLVKAQPNPEMVNLNPMQELQKQFRKK